MLYWCKERKSRSTTVGQYLHLAQEVERKTERTLFEVVGATSSQTSYPLTYI